MTITPNDLRSAIEVIRGDLAFEGDDRLNEITVPPGIGLIAYLRWEAERRNVRLIDVRLGQIAAHELAHSDPAVELGIDGNETLVVLSDVPAATPEVINSFSALAARPNVRVLKVSYQ
jgi:hypothetical protein